MVFTTAGGERSTVRIAVGVPAQTEAGEYACPVTMEGLHERREARGEDAYQSLVLGLRLIRQLVRCFVEDGGTVCFADEKDTPIRLDDIDGLF